MELTPNLKPKQEMTDEQRKEALAKFFSETEIDQLTFSTQEEAKAHVDMVNAKYGDISFVEEDRGGFTVKFRGSHLGEGFLDERQLNNEDLNKAA
jgi:hypothetical protein